MALDTRLFLTKCLLIGALAPFAAACSSDDGDPALTGGAGGTADSGRPDVNASGGNAGTTSAADAARTDSGGSAGFGANDGGGGSAFVDTGTTDEPDAGLVCTTPQYSRVTAFGSIFDGWGIANISSTELWQGTDPDSGAPTGTLLALDATVGSPDPGSVKLTIPFTDWGQKLVFAQLWNGLNMSGSTLSVQIRLDSGLNATPLYAGQAYLVVKTGPNYTYGPGTPINLDSSAGWQTLTLDLDKPSPTPDTGHNPCDVREIDIFIETPNLPITVTPTPGTFTTAVVHIDTIAILPKGTVLDGGTRADATAAPDAPNPADATAAPDAREASTDAGAEAASIPAEAASDATGQ